MNLENERCVPSMPMLEVAHAHVLSVKEQFSECLEILSPLLPAVEWDGKDLTLYQAYREAAACASKLDDWAGAADLLREAAERIDQSAHTLWAIALETDAAFAYWSAERCDMIPDRLSTAASLLGSLVEDTDDWKQFMVLKRVGHTFMCMANPASSSSGFSVPFAAMSSNLDTELPPDAPVPPRTPIDCILAYIVELLFVTGASDSVAAPYLSRVCNSNLAPARVIGRLMTVYRAAKIGAASGFIRLLATLSAEMRGMAGAPAGPPVAAPNDVVLGAFMPGLNSSLNREILDEWRNDAIEAGFEAELSPVLDLLHRVFLDDAFDPSTAFAVDDPIEQILSTVKYVSVSNPTVGGWLRVHGVWALFFGQHHFKQIAGALLLPLIESKWAEFSECPFILSSPRTSVPRLTAALSSNSRPWRKIRDILRAAEAAAGANLPLAVLTTIDRLADKT